MYKSIYEYGCSVIYLQMFLFTSLKAASKHIWSDGNGEKSINRFLSSFHSRVLIIRYHSQDDREIKINKNCAFYTQHHISNEAFIIEPRQPHSTLSHFVFFAPPSICNDNSVSGLHIFASIKVGLMFHLKMLLDTANVIVLTFHSKKPPSRIISRL